MSQILVRDLAPEVVEELKQIAKLNHRSLQAQVKTMLEDAAAQRRRRLEFLEMAREIRERSPKQTTDSVDLIREDRDSR
jgi:antitoxin FitA